MKTHALSKTPEYGVWQRMWSRCTNSKLPKYSRYGGRGITICARWKDFSAFIQDVGPRPTAVHSLDRINNDGNYEPGNCRWATASEQATNRSTSVVLEWKGESKPLADWAWHLGLSRDTLYQRYRIGMPIEAIMNKQTGGLGRKFIEVDGIQKMTTEWMRDLGIPISSFYHFRRKGLSESEIVRRYQTRQP